MAAPATDVPIRPDIPEAHRVVWERISRAGSWWTGSLRVAIARSARDARGCALCQSRKEALSPQAVAGQHDGETPLSPDVVDVIHRVTTDPGRLSRSWFEGVRAGGLEEGPYVELLGVVVAVVSMDAFCHALGLPFEPLPEPVAGEPSHYRPANAAREQAFVPMIPARGARGAEADLWQPPRTGNVVRALSLVPDAVRDLKTLSAAHYLPMDLVAVPTANGGRALTRAQIELVAGRVSAINECFY
ncbi:MAG: hypothetical protein MJE66_10735 [Proteobacteria bacterium]|nr:hypothetical protein [Pseudomonadota bacterium]